MTLAMSSNKGKDGEMRVLRLLTHIVESEEECDITRHTNTNTADGGADLVFEHPKVLLSRIGNIANDTEEQEKTDPKDTQRVKTRIDVKTTSEKISPDTVYKFAGDVRRNPDCFGHVLMGGVDLSPLAQTKFNEIQKAQAEVGKCVTYIPNAGIERLEQHYKALPAPSNGNKKQPNKSVQRTRLPRR